VFDPGSGHKGHPFWNLISADMWAIPVIDYKRHLSTAGPVSFPGCASASQARPSLGEKSLTYFSILLKIVENI
jgi:hypothetical protein